MNSRQHQSYYFKKQHPFFCFCWSKSEIMFLIFFNGSFSCIFFILYVIYQSIQIIKKFFIARTWFDFICISSNIVNQFFWFIKVSFRAQPFLVVQSFLTLSFFHPVLTLCLFHRLIQTVCSQTFSFYPLLTHHHYHDHFYRHYNTFSKARQHFS